MRGACQPDHGRGDERKRADQPSLVTGEGSGHSEQPGNGDPHQRDGHERDRVVKQHQRLAGPARHALNANSVEF